jgi:polar amino acid transport system permease protein
MYYLLCASLAYVAGKGLKRRRQAAR